MIWETYMVGTEYKNIWDQSKEDFLNLINCSKIVLSKQYLKTFNTLWFIEYLVYGHSLNKERHKWYRYDVYCLKLR